MIEENLLQKRIIGKAGNSDERKLVFFGGIHGNEPSGVQALEEIFQELASLDLKGQIIGISGNHWALQNGKRFHSQDLNRLWTQNAIQALESHQFVAKTPDEEQQLEIYHLLEELMDNRSAPLYFFDLHTTSSPTVPFITLNDSLLNRKFVQQYPLPLILGIEEYLDGPLLSYLNELGYVSFGFEGGQHEDPVSVQNHKAFIYLTMVFTGMLDKNDIDFEVYWNQLQQKSLNINGFYEINSKYSIQENENFMMKPGYSNFQTIARGESIATSNDADITIEQKSRIFMPLYQNQGTDGFFLIRKTPIAFLRLSSFVRKLHFDAFFPMLPGVQWMDLSKTSMKVNLKISRLVAKPLFHLFGYRAKQINDEKLIVKSREKNAKNELYKDEKWY